MMNKSIYCCIIISLLLFVSCSEDEPLQANNYIDPKLFGEWYLIDTLTPNFPSPEYSFRGFQINQNHQMIPLGIETSTGSVAYREYPVIDSIVYAYNGKMLLNRFWWGGHSDTVNYIVDQEKLILKMDAITYLYHKTSLSTQLLDPIMSNLSVKVDTLSVSNFKVYYYPSTYISKKGPSNIFLYANISLSSSMSFAMITIEINNFNGIGEYVIPYKQGKYLVVDGDVVMEFFSDSSLANIISIDQFDEVNKSCSGSFSFSIGNLTIELSDGVFTAPIYQ
jgi:hypothetical protein